MMGRKARKVSEPVVVPRETGPLFYRENGKDMFCVLGPEPRGPRVVTQGDIGKYPDLWAKYKAS
jgi:hypothetical protein